MDDSPAASVLKSSSSACPAAPYAATIASSSTTTATLSVFIGGALEVESEDRDEFRKKEKQVKKYFTSLRMQKLLQAEGPIYIEGSNSKQKLSNKDKRRRLEEVKKVLDGGTFGFGADDIVDFRKAGVGIRCTMSDAFPAGRLGGSEDVGSETKHSDTSNSNSVGRNNNIYGSKAALFQLPPELQAAAGFYVITEAFDLDSQLAWGKIAVEQYSRSLHTNLTNLRKQSQFARAETKQGIGEGGMSGSKDGEKKEEVAEEDLSNLWENSVKDDDDFERFKPLRWASLGYHYDWTARMYQEHNVSPFPKDFAALCSNIATSLGLSLKPEAAIINYYPIGAIMSGHLDDAEHNLNEPIVSISLGCPAIFLLGKQTKDIAPIPILLRSGDVLVMSGESRYCYHGVATVLGFDEIGEKNHFQGMAGGGAEFESVCKYLSLFRLNLNSRRVTLGHGKWTNKCGSGALAQAYGNNTNGGSGS